MRTDAHVKRPVMRLRVGAQHYFSHRSKKPTGDWNEGFVFVISYHSQLFDTLEVISSVVDLFVYSAPL
jgi:hypothetical protein